MTHFKILLLLILIARIGVFGQTLEEHEKEIAAKNNLKTKAQWDYNYTGGKHEAQGKRTSITTYSRSGEILRVDFLSSNGQVTSWERYDYDERGNRILYERESTNSKYKKESKYDLNNNVILEAGFNGGETFRNTYEYNSQGKLTEVIRSAGNKIDEKIVYNHSGNTANVNVYTGGKTLTSKLKLVYDSKGNILEEAVLSVDNRELESKKFRYNSRSEIIEEEKTRNGKFYYRITYEYDTSERLTSVSEETLAKKKYVKKIYTYDLNGNLTEYKWRRNPDDEFNVKEYTYDSQGICTSVHTLYPQSNYELLTKFMYESF